jgi:prepilin-type N-terminal cleavage/methylation domain-containing protein
MKGTVAPVRGFTLLEVLVVMLIVTILMSGLAVPLAAQAAMRRLEETRRILDDAREALVGFAVANGRLPCPATLASRGEESFDPGGDATNGNCSNFHDGYLPAAAIGLAPLDSEGFARDGWGTEANRVRYAVFGGGRSLGGVTNPFTRTNGMQAATLLSLGAAPSYLFICASAAGATASDCGPAANQLTRRAAFVLVSTGPNGAVGTSPGPDEARNRDASPVFVWHENADLPGNAFDDYLTWVPVGVLASRLVAAGRLP